MSARGARCGACGVCGSRSLLLGLLLLLAHKLAAGFYQGLGGIYLGGEVRIARQVFAVVQAIKQFLHVDVVPLHAYHLPSPRMS